MQKHMIQLKGLKDSNIVYVPPSYGKWFSKFEEPAPDGLYEKLYEGEYDSAEEMRQEMEPYGTKGSWRNDRMLLCVQAFEFFWDMQEALSYAEDNGIVIEETHTGLIY